jgi:ATPase subunit of ABC transporter with duplicated ATPase domains
MTDEDGMRLGELEGIVAENDGYTAESDAAILLTASTFRNRCTNAHERIAGRPEGARAARAGPVRHPQALLLDEPTNHLDLDSIHWLQDFMNATRAR